MFSNLPKILKFLWHFEILVNTGPYGVGHFKTVRTPPTVFIRSEAKFMINKAVIKKSKVINVLAIC